MVSSKRIRELKYVKTKLDKNMVDFLAIFAYLNQLWVIWKASLFVSALATTTLEKNVYGSVGEL